MLGCLHQLFLTFAIIVASIIGLCLPDASSTSMHDLQNSNSWRLAFGFPAIICLAQVLLVVLVYKEDSPIFYVTKGKMAEAESAYKKIYADDESANEALKEAQSANSKSAQNTSVFLRIMIINLGWCFIIHKL